MRKQHFIFMNCTMLLEKSEVEVTFIIMKNTSYMKMTLVFLIFITIHEFMNSYIVFNLNEAETEQL
jgi:hypothetical protein